MAGSLAPDARPYGRKCAGIRLWMIRRTVRSAGCFRAEGAVVDYRSLAPRHPRSQPTSDAAYLPWLGLFILEPPIGRLAHLLLRSHYPLWPEAVFDYPPASRVWLLILATPTGCHGNRLQTIGRMTYSGAYACPTQYDVPRRSQVALERCPGAPRPEVCDVGIGCGSAAIGDVSSVSGSRARGSGPLQPRPGS